METQHLAWILQKSLWTLNILAGVLVVWRLYSAGLYRRYRFFFAGTVLVVARSAALFPFSPLTPVYYGIWASTEPFLWLAYSLVVFELYTLVLKEYRGIYSLGRWFFFTAMATSVILSALTIFPTTAGALARYPLLHFYALIERAIVTTLAIFLLLLLALVTWFPVPLSRNLLIHCCVYSAYFFANNVTALYWHFGAQKGWFMSSDSKLAVALACSFCWVIFLSHRGEDRIASLHLGRSPLQEKRLLGQLEGLNATLLRTARK